MLNNNQFNGLSPVLLITSTLYIYLYPAIYGILISLINNNVLMEHRPLVL